MQFGQTIVKFDPSDPFGHFDVYAGNFCLCHGQCQDAFATIVAGQVVERPNGSFAVLITMSNGKVAEFEGLENGGTSKLVRWT